MQEQTQDEGRKSRTRVSDTLQVWDPQRVPGGDGSPRLRTQNNARASLPAARRTRADPGTASHPTGHTHINAPESFSLQFPGSFLSSRERPKSRVAPGCCGGVGWPASYRDDCCVQYRNRAARSKHNHAGCFLKTGLTQTRSAAGTSGANSPSCSLQARGRCREGDLGACPAPDPAPGTRSARKVNLAGLKSAPVNPRTRFCPESPRSGLTSP